MTGWASLVLLFLIKEGDASLQCVFVPSRPWLCPVLGTAAEVPVATSGTSAGLEVPPHPLPGEKVQLLEVEQQGQSLISAPGAQPVGAVAVTLFLVTLCQFLFPVPSLGLLHPGWGQRPNSEHVLFNQGKCNIYFL